jgi:hypothetical protein
VPGAHARPTTRKRPTLRFEVTHRLPGQDAPTRTVTDAVGVAALVEYAAAAGTRVYIRPATRSDVVAAKPTAA